MAKPMCGHSEFQENCIACKLYRDDPNYRAAMEARSKGQKLVQLRPTGGRKPGDCNCGKKKIQGENTK